MSFNGDEVMLETAYGLEISQYLTAITGIPSKQKLVECYTLEAGGDDESFDGIEVIAVRNQNSCFDGIPRKRDSNSTSPILRNGEHRKGFRQRREVKRAHQYEPLTIEDSVEELSRIMNTDFGSGEAEWTHETDSPVYDRVASARVDCTLKLSRLTYTSLSQTLKWNRKAQKRKKKISIEDAHPVNDSVNATTKVSPPPLPPKPARFTTSLTVSVTQQNIVSNEEQDEPEEETDFPQHRQRLGTYILEAHQNQPAAGKRSRPVQPGEALKVVLLVRIVTFIISDIRTTLHFEENFVYFV